MLQRKTCENCANYKLRNTWTAQAQAFTMQGDEAKNLTVIPQPPAPPPITVYPGAYVETPVAQQTTESNVKVPFAQSLIAGGFMGGITACSVYFLGLPKPGLLISASALYAAYNRWNGGLNLADSLLVRIEDYTKIDWNRDGKVGSEKKPRPQLRFVAVRGKGGMSNLPVYEPEQNEQHLDIPGMPRSKEDQDPWTIERLCDFLDRAFETKRWARAHCNELGVSQGQWSALQTFVQSFETDNAGKKIITIWGTDDRPTLEGFVRQLAGVVSQPTG